MTAFTLTFPAQNATVLISRAVCDERGNFIAWKRLWRQDGGEIVATYPDRFTLAATLLGSMPVEQLLELIGVDK